MLKRHMLRMYGFRLAAWGAGIARVYSRIAFRRIAREVARQIADYVAAGFEVEAVIGVDGSPTCGVATTNDLRGSVRDIAGIDPRTFTTADQNSLVRRHVVPGTGVFIDELHKQLRRRRVHVRFVAHDLVAELDALA